ncbi:unnamed protein product [Ectocarpus fasciculatus]
MGSGYSTPFENPFSGGGGSPEICAQGFRNPYRCNFDRLNDDLHCGDVGHLNVESIKKVECGQNYGWRQFVEESGAWNRSRTSSPSCASLSTGPPSPPEVQVKRID